MYLLVLIIDKAENIEKIITGFREIGITGATIFDSIGLGRNTLYGKSMPPVIASLKRIFDPESRTYNHTMINIIRKKETLDDAMRVAEEVCGSFDQPDMGIMFSLELDKVVGFSTINPIDAEES